MLTELTAWVGAVTAGGEELPPALSNSAPQWLPLYSLKSPPVGIGIRDIPGVGWNLVNEHREERTVSTSVDRGPLQVVYH
jgi:hypothetical protein